MNALADFQDETVFFNAFFESSFFGKKQQHQVTKDIKQLEEDWLAATSSQQLPALLKRYNTTYFGALCSFSKKVARLVSLDSFTYLIDQAKKLNLPLSIRLFNSAGQQAAHQALITTRLQENLMLLNWQAGQVELEPSRFEFAFISRLPCDDACGWVSCLEIFGAEGELLLQVQGSCESQQAEDLRLRDIFSSLS